MQRPGEYGTAGTGDTGKETVSDLSFVSHLSLHVAQPCFYGVSRYWVLVGRGVIQCGKDVKSDCFSKC